MQTAQGKVGPGMIESRLIQADYVSIAAFVIGMAIGAFPIPHVVDPAMIALYLLDIGVDSLMAVETKPALRNVIEHGVALGAVVLEFHVAGDHRPRHH